jgi:hypothetical protein
MCTPSGRFTFSAPSASRRKALTDGLQSSDVVSENKAARTNTD